MEPLKRPKHEQFAQGVARGLSASAAYRAAGYSGAGGGQSAARLLRSAEIAARVLELKQALANRIIAAEIGIRNARVAALQDRWERMKKIILERAADESYAKIPGGSSGLLCRDFRGKDASQEIFRLDTGLLQEMRMVEKQAAQELGQWSETADESKSDEIQRFSGTMEELLILYRRVTTVRPAA